MNASGRLGYHALPMSLLKGRASHCSDRLLPSALCFLLVITIYFKGTLLVLRLCDTHRWQLGGSLTQPPIRSSLRNSFPQHFSSEHAGMEHLPQTPEVTASHFVMNCLPSEGQHWWGAGNWFSHMFLEMHRDFSLSALCKVQ